MSTAVNVRTLGVLPWQVAVDTPFRMLRMLESTLGIGTLPRQTGVYVPRRLSHIGGPVTGTLGRRAFDAIGLLLWHGWSAADPVPC